MIKFIKFCAVFGFWIFYLVLFFILILLPHIFYFNDLISILNFNVFMIYYVGYNVIILAFLIISGVMISTEIIMILDGKL